MKKYNLDDFFGLLLSDDLSKKIHIKNNLKNYRELINHYKDKISQSSLFPPALISSTDSQLYTTDYILPFNENYFSLAWDIDKIKYIITNYNKSYRNKSDYKNGRKISIRNGSNVIEDDLIRTKFDTDILANQIDLNSINTTHSKRCADSDDPIIVIDYRSLGGPSMPFLVIDGNHRVYGKSQKKIKYVNAYYVSQNLWLQSLFSDVDINFVKIFCNVDLILYYMEGVINLTQLNEQLYSL